MLLRPVRLQPPRPRGKYVLVDLVLSLEIWKLALSFALWKGTLPPGLARSKSIRRSIPTPQEGSQIHLHQSAQIGAAESVEVLLKAGANVSEPSHAVPPFGATPLFRAALGGHVPVVKMLLEARADPNQLCEVFVGGVLGSSNKSIVARPIDWATGPAGPEVVKLLRAYGSLPSSQPKVLFDEMPPDAPASSLSSVADNKTWNVPKFVNMSIPMWCWLESDQEKWTQLADPHKAWVASTLKIDPLPSMAKRERSRYISVKGQPLLPEDAVNLHDEPGEELLEQMEKALASFFQTDEVILIPGGSSSRLTDLESSDWDYYFDVPGTVVTAEQRDKLLTHLCDKLSCSGKLSPRGIAIQLQVDDISLELVPLSASYFDWESVEFSRFLGSTNRSKNDASLQLFLSGNEGARVVIRELKAAFVDSLVPNFLIENLVKRVAMMSIRHEAGEGFVIRWPLTSTYDLLRNIFAELASFESNLVMQPLVPLVPPASLEVVTHCNLQILQFKVAQPPEEDVKQRSL